MKKEGNGFLSDMEFTIRKAGAAERAALAYLESILQTRSEPDFADLVFMEHDSGNRTLFLGYDGETPAGYVILNHHPAYPPFIRLQIPEIQDLRTMRGRKGRSGSALPSGWIVPTARRSAFTCALATSPTAAASPMTASRSRPAQSMRSMTICA
ncbi:MAG: hypothetical protein HYU57_03660 [Micavibrio aeruginosavorus]|nr:hypothetical protein [Micavibrio aeruginosavorus]